jgi:hypothetical protein
MFPQRIFSWNRTEIPIFTFQILALMRTKTVIYLERRIRSPEVTIPQPYIRFLAEVFFVIGYALAEH